MIKFILSSKTHLSLCLIHTDVPEITQQQPPYRTRTLTHVHTNTPIQTDSCKTGKSSMSTVMACVRLRGAFGLCPLSNSISFPSANSSATEGHAHFIPSGVCSKPDVCSWVHVNIHCLCVQLSKKTCVRAHTHTHGLVQRMVCICFQ